MVVVKMSRQRCRKRKSREECEHKCPSGGLKERSWSLNVIQFLCVFFSLFCERKIKRKEKRKKKRRKKKGKSYTCDGIPTKSPGHLGRLKKMFFWEQREVHKTWFCGMNLTVKFQQWIPFSKGSGCLLSYKAASPLMLSLPEIKSWASKK